MIKLQSHAMTFTMALFAFALKALVGKYLMGTQAITNLVHQLEPASELLHNQISNSWLELNSAPSAKNLTLQLELNSAPCKTWPCS